MVYYFTFENKNYCESNTKHSLNTVQKLPYGFVVDHADFKEIISWKNLGELVNSV